MFKHLLAAVGLVLLSAAALTAQTNDPVLFTVGNAPVTLSEFRYAYTKTNQDKADFSEKSLRDYLELYAKFKLKVQNARDLQLDTVSATQAELEGYRRTLAKSYLEDKEVTDKLIKEAYDRMQKDADISHIFIACDRNAKAADTLKAFNKATNLLKMLKSGKALEQLAADSSDDKTAKETRGSLGFITAMLPDGYYLLEKAIYAATPGQLYGPIRTNAGYHIIRVNSFRPARGEVEVAQILLRKVENNPAKTALAKARIDSVYTALQAGGKWDELCAKYSEDKNTATKGGYIGFFGINRYQKNFEDAAFNLAKDGDYSAPVETNIGWHIIKRVSRRPIGTFESMKKPLADRVRRDSRSEMAKQSMIARIKREGKFEEYPAVLNTWASKLDSSFVTFKWKPAESKPQDVLMRYGTAQKYTIADFEDYASRASRERMRASGTPIRELVDRLYKAWSDDIAMQFEETQLDVKYPDFKSLMREYTEGIIMFEAMKVNVFDRANTDSIGLDQYFRANLSQKYKWDERARVSIYTLKTDDLKMAERVHALAAKKPAADVLKKFNKKDNAIVNVLEHYYEKGKNKELGTLWTTGAITDIKTDAGTKTASFLKIEEIVPPTPKTLSEARGYAVADYQDYVEKEWIEGLRKKYPVKINEAVLSGIIKK